MIQKINELIHKQLRNRSTPEQLARGAAIGIFIALTPTFGLQIFLCIGFAWLLRANKTIAAAMAFVTNPWTMLPIHYAEGRVAEAVIPYEQKIFNRQAVRELFLDHNEPEMPRTEQVRRIVLGRQSREYFKRMVAGSIILGIPASAIIYFVVLRAARRQLRLRKAAEARKLKKQQEQALADPKHD